MLVCVCDRLSICSPTMILNWHPPASAPPELGLNAGATTLACTRKACLELQIFQQPGKGHLARLHPHSLLESALTATHALIGSPLVRYSIFPPHCAFADQSDSRNGLALIAPPFAGRSRGAGRIGLLGREGRTRKGRGPGVQSGQNGDSARNLRESSDESAQKAPVEGLAGLEPGTAG